MRLLRFLVLLALVSQVGIRTGQAQLADGQCSVPLDAAPFKSKVENDWGLPQAVDFAIAAPLMATSPVADGKLTAGEYSNECHFSFADHTNPGFPWPGLDNLQGGEADLSANMYFAHTSQFLYVAFDVTDDFLDLDFPANSFQNDGVEIFINPDGDVGDAWGPGKYQLYVDAAGDGDIELNNRGVTGQGPAPLSTNDAPPGAFEWYSAGLPKSDNKGYIVEFQIPLATLDTAGGDNGDPVPLKEGEFILINTAIDDNDATDDLTAQTGHHLMWQFDGESRSPWGGGEDIWPVPLQLTPAVVVGKPGDVNGDGSVDAGDIDALAAAVRGANTAAKYDLDGNSQVNFDDRDYLVNSLIKSYIGDANLDGKFDSDDFIQVFVTGEYEDATNGNSGWGDGDWDGDGDFTSGDFVAAFVAGGYDAGPRAAVASVPEPSSLVLLGLSALGLLGARRR